MLKIRLMRIGAKKRPFYRVVAVDERSKRTGAYVELLGTYNPLTEPKEIKLNQERIDYWLKQGAQPSDGYLRIIGKAPQRPPRKPKKEKKEVAPVAAPEAAAVEETLAETAEEAKSEPAEPTGAVESAPEKEVSEDSNSQQTRSEDQSEISEDENTSPSGGERPDEPPTEQPAVESEVKKDEGST